MLIWQQMQRLNSISMWNAERLQQQYHFDNFELILYSNHDFERIATHIHVDKQWNLAINENGLARAWYSFIH